MDKIDQHLFTYEIFSLYNKWVYHEEATNLARLEHRATSSEGGGLSKEFNVGDEDNGIFIFYLICKN